MPSVPFRTSANSADQVQTAQECGVWSGSDLFTYRNFYKIKIKMKKYTRHLMKKGLVRLIKWANMGIIYILPSNLSLRYCFVLYFVSIFYIARSLSRFIVFMLYLCLFTSSPVGSIRRLWASVFTLPGHLQMYSNARTCLDRVLNLAAHFGSPFSSIVIELNLKLAGNTIHGWLAVGVTA